MSESQPSHSPYAEDEYTQDDDHVAMNVADDAHEIATESLKRTEQVRASVVILERIIRPSVCERRGESSRFDSLQREIAELRELVMQVLVLAKDNEATAAAVPGIAMRVLELELWEPPSRHHERYTAGNLVAFC